MSMGRRAVTVVAVVWSLAVPTALAEGSPPAASSPSGSPEASAESTPTGDRQATLVGTALDAVPDGTPGEVTVVAIGPTGGEYVPVVVRNDTDAVVVDAQVSMEAVGPDGEVVVRGSLRGELAPYRLQPGEIAVGDVWFGGAAIPADATLEAETSVPDDDSFPDKVDYEIREATVEDGMVSGVIANGSDRPTGDLTAMVTVMCFDGATPTVREGIILSSPPALAPGEEAPFAVERFLDTQCEEYLVAVGGFAAS
jgi:hypothetical protein